MKIIPGGRNSNYLARFGIFLIIAALIIGFPSSYSVDGDNSQPSQNLEIYTWYDLDAVRDNLSGSHILMNDLNSTTEGYTELASPTANGGNGWEPIGNTTEVGGGCSSGWSIYYYLSGTFDGQGHEIRDLFINRPDENGVGLFYGTSDSGYIGNLGVTNFTVTGADYVGSLVGSNEGTVDNSYSSGNVTGESRVGGLAGHNRGGTVFNSYSSGNVTGSSSVGGLVGSMWYGTVNNSHSMCNVIGLDNVGGLVGYSYYDGTVSNSYSTGNVTGDSNVGGLLGSNGHETGRGEGSNVYDSYSTGNVNGNQNVGGLVGKNVGSSTVSNSYSTGNVTGHSDVGGLVGNNSGGVNNSHSTGSVIGLDNVGGLVGYIEYGTVKNSYSTGNVNGNQNVGGLVGKNGVTSTASNSYATGNVTGYSDVGGLVGVNNGSVSNSHSTGSVIGVNNVGGLVGNNYYGPVRNSFWDTETSGQATSDGGTGKNTTEMKSITTFSGVDWNIIAVANTTMRDTSYIWNIVNNVTYPFLSWQP